MKNNKRAGFFVVGFVVMLVITVVMACFVAYLLFLRLSAQPLTPDYAPRQEEAHAQVMDDAAESKPEQPQGGGSVSLTYSKDVTITLSAKAATLYFANPGKSNQDMVVQIVIQDKIVVQSGLLKPGHQITTLDLADSAKDQLTAGGYEGKFVVHYYDPITAEKAILTTEIPLRIEVID